MQRDHLTKSRNFTSLLLPILAMLLSACAVKPHKVDGMEGDQHAINSINEKWANEKSQLMVGENAAEMMGLAGDVFKDEAALRRLLLKYAKESDQESRTLAQLVKDVRARNREAEGGTRPFKGLGGLYFQNLLNTAELNINPNTGGYTSLDERPELWGKIIDFKFKYNPKTSGGSGIMDVSTIEILKRGDTIVGANHFLWEIEITNDAYVIHDIGTNVVPDPATWTDAQWDNWKPFPDTLFFSVPMKQRIHMKKFDVKLHARGTDIKVKRLTVNGHVVTPADRDYWPLTLPDPENCIDIFFALGDANGDGDPDLNKIPTRYDQLTEQVYCLGRCKDPAIVNSR